MKKGTFELESNENYLYIFSHEQYSWTWSFSEEKKELIKVFDQEGNILLDLHNIAVLHHAAVQSTYFTRVDLGNP